MTLRPLLPCLFCLIGSASFSSSGWAEENCESELTSHQLNLLERTQGDLSLKMHRKDFEFLVFTKAVQGERRSVVLVADNPVKKSAAAMAKRNLIRAFPYVAATRFETKIPESVIRKLDAARARSLVLYDRNHEYPGLIQLDIPRFDSTFSILAESVADLCGGYVLPVATAACVASYFISPELTVPSVKAGVGAMAIWGLLDENRGAFSVFKHRKYDQSVFETIRSDLTEQTHVKKSLVFVDYRRFTKIARVFEANGWVRQK